MTLCVRRVFLAVVVLLLLATGCGSSGESTLLGESDASSAALTPDAEPSDPPATTEALAESEATSIPVPADDSDIDEAIAGLDGEPAEPIADADPTTTAQGFVRSQFNIDPEAEWLACIVAEGEQDEVLELTLRTPGVEVGQVDDAQLRALAYAINGCVQTISLADWAAQAVGSQEELRTSAPPCFEERFDDPDSGDVTFFNFVALLYQFRLEPSGTDGLIDSLASCAPITALADFFAGQTAPQLGPGEVIDLECFRELLSPAEVTRSFWTTFVEGGALPATVVEPLALQCVTVPPTPTPAPTPAPIAELTSFVPWSGTRQLTAVNPVLRVNAYNAPPPMVIDPAGRYQAVLMTGGGEIRIELFADSAPITVNNFVQLARDGFYDNTTFHRVMQDFMAQGGDPGGDGFGGPGYQFVDEVDNGAVFDRKGQVAMANSGVNTNGSQFFITFIPTDWLTGNHTIFGQVTEGLDIVDAIPLTGEGPAQVIESVVIIEG